MELNEQVFFVIVFIKRHGGGGLGRIAMAFHLGQNDFGDKGQIKFAHLIQWYPCLLYTSPSPRDLSTSRMPSSA